MFVMRLRAKDSCLRDALEATDGVESPFSFLSRSKKAGPQKLHELKVTSLHTSFGCLLCRTTSIAHGETILAHSCLPSAPPLTDHFGCGYRTSSLMRPTYGVAVRAPPRSCLLPLQICLPRTTGWRLEAFLRDECKEEWGEGGTCYRTASAPQAPRQEWREVVVDLDNCVLIPRLRTSC